MQSTHWTALLKKLPPEVHNQFAVTTRGGTEINVQTILLMEGECLVFKGRLAACQDTGRLFFVPFDQIDFIGFTRSVSEEEYKAWFGEPSAPATSSTDRPAEGVAPNMRTPMPSRAA